MWTELTYFSINEIKCITLANIFFQKQLTMFLYRNRRLISTFRLKVEVHTFSSKSYRPESHTRNIIISGLVAYRAVMRTNSVHSTYI